MEVLNESDWLERIVAVLRKEERANWNLELGTDEDVAELARVLIQAFKSAR